MVERSKRICLYEKEKVEEINPETLKLFQKYERDMSVRGLKDSTILNYKSDLIQWFIYMYNNQFNLSVLEATDDDIEEYYFFRKQNGNNVNRQKRVMSSISAFYKFLRKKKFINESPVEFIDRPKAGLPVVTQTYLTKDDVELMRQKLRENGDIQLLVYAFISLTTMGRVNAIAHLRWEQQNKENRTFENVLEKEGKVVEFSYTQEVQEYLDELIQYRKDNEIDDHGWVFITGHTTDKSSVRNATLNDWCKSIGEMIGHPTLHCHDFRHSYSNLLKDNGVSLEDISVMLNHAGTDVTRKFYLKTNLSKVRKIKDDIKI